MHAFKFSLIAVLSCIAMIGAVPVGNRAPAEAIVRRQDGLGAGVGNGPFSGLNNPGPTLDDLTSGETGTVPCQSGSLCASVAGTANSLGNLLGRPSMMHPPYAVGDPFLRV